MPKIRKIERFSGKVEDGRTDRQTVIHKKKKNKQDTECLQFCPQIYFKTSIEDWKTKNSEGHNIEIHLLDVEPV